MKGYFIHFFAWQVVTDRAIQRVWNEFSGKKGLIYLETQGTSLVVANRFSNKALYMLDPTKHNFATGNLTSGPVLAGPGEPQGVQAATFLHSLQSSVIIDCSSLESMPVSRMGGSKEPLSQL